MKFHLARTFLRFTLIYLTAGVILSGCRKSSGSSTTVNGDHTSLIVSIPEAGTRDGVDTAVAVPESSLKSALVKAAGMIRLADAGEDLEKRKRELATLLEDASGKLDEWSETVGAQMRGEQSQAITRDGNAYLARLSSLSYLTDEQSRLLSEITNNRKIVERDFQNYEKTNGKVGFRSAAVDPLSETMATATWWALSQLLRQVAGVHRGKKSDNGEGFSIDGIVIGNSVSDQQVLFELDPRAGYFIIINSMSGRTFFDYVSAGQSKPLKLEPGGNPTFNVMRDRIVATVNSSNDMEGDSAQRELAQAANKQTEAFGKSIASAQTFLHSGEEMANSITKAAELNHQMKVGEEKIVTARHKVTALEESLRTLEAKKNEKPKTSSTR